jgi:hypothetical protein
MIAEVQLRYSQRESETQLVPKTQLSALSHLSKTLSVEMSLDEDSSNNSNPEPRRLGRVKRPTHDAASQASQDIAAAAALAATTKSLKGKKVRKARLMNTSQLLDEFTLE